MIKAEELRVGNLVMWYGKPFVVDADFIRRAELVDWQENDGTPCHPDPIPLTSEILEACGTLKGRCFYVKKDGEVVRFVMWNNHFGEYWYNNGNNEVYIKYLHQLQNLYYALTVSELQVNLKEKA